MAKSDNKTRNSQKDKSSKDIDFTEQYSSRAQKILFRWVDKKKISIVKKLFDNKKYNILDYGCGAGFVTSKIQGCKLYGFDENENLLKIAKKNGLITRKGDFFRIPFANNFFDAIISIDTIEHVASRDAFFKEVKRVLKKNGTVVVFTPNYTSPLWPLAEGVANRITGHPSGHISPWNKEALTHFMDKNFKKNDKIKTINYSLGIVAIGKFKK